MEPSKAKWAVGLTGDDFDLEHLARHFSTPEVTVEKDSIRDSGHFLFSLRFGNLASSDSVLQAAEGIVCILNGALRLERRARVPITVGAVYRLHPDGRRDVFVHIREVLTMHASFGEATVTVMDADGNPVPQVPAKPRTVRLVDLAECDEATRKVLRLVASGDLATWVGLYRIFEVIEHDTKGRIPWGTVSDRRRFTHSVNSVAVAGDGARHGKETIQPPARPMTLDEAEAFVSSVLEAWLTSKGG